MIPDATTGPSPWLQGRAVIFGLALFNFAVVWTLDQRMGGIAALVDPWYHPWSYFNEPSRLLVAASLLAVGRAWTDLAALSPSGYMVIRFVYLFTYWNGDWQWSFLGKYGAPFAGSWESQYLLALGILCASVCYRLASLRRSKMGAHQLMRNLEQGPEPLVGLRIETTQDKVFLMMFDTDDFQRIVDTLDEPQDLIGPTKLVISRSDRT